MIIGLSIIVSMKINFAIIVAFDIKMVKEILTLKQIIIFLFLLYFNLNYCYY